MAEDKDEARTASDPVERREAPAAAPTMSAQEDVPAKPRRHRRTKKQIEEDEMHAQQAAVLAVAQAARADHDAAGTSAGAPSNASDSHEGQGSGEAEHPARRRRRSRRPSENGGTASAVSEDEGAPRAAASSDVQAEAGSREMGAPQMTLSDLDAASGKAGDAVSKDADGQHERSERKRPGRGVNRRQNHRGADASDKDAQQNGGDKQAESASAETREQPGGQKESSSNANGQQDGQEDGQQNSRRNHRNHERRNRNRNNNGKRNNNQNHNNHAAQAEPSLSREDVAAMKVVDLRKKAEELEVPYAGIRKKDLVEAVYVAAARAEGFRGVKGVLEIEREGYGVVRTGNYMRGDDDAFVHQGIIRQYGLRAGDEIEATVGPGRSNSKFPPVQKLTLVNGRDPEEMRHRPRFRDLTPIYPNERLVMEHGRDSITGRAIDLVAPIGKGQRGLIVSPPKAGKTTVLKNICQSIAANNPEVHLICLLVDERPEEVTDMQRSIKGEVVASTFDMPASNHTAVSELVIERAKRLVELGEDVVVVLDSITRLARAYNLATPASGRILSGGVDSAALYPPKKFLGAARNIENGGSLTILASALVDTGSKMDEVIFEEFKGTGNMELKLDRDLADRRIFPAIDPVASGTRNEELLLDEQLTPFIWGLRRVLANMNNIERAAQALVKGLRATKDNEEFLIRSAKKAQATDAYMG